MVRRATCSSARFDPRPHARGDFDFGCRRRYRDGFDPRPHARGDSCNMMKIHVTEQFRSTPPREGRRVPDAAEAPSSTFRSTPPREGRRCAPEVQRYLQSTQRFDPRPHARGDGRSARTQNSFRCPHARGDSSRRPLSCVSIHAPTRGATNLGALGELGRRMVQFRSTPPREGRQRRTGQAEITRSLSFDPRPHARGDDLRKRCAGRLCDVGKFRSTPPREGRPFALGSLRNITACISVSIHAPTRGATMHQPAVDRRVTDKEQFRSTPPREGRLPYRNLLILRRKSTPRREACKQSEILPQG